MILMVTYAGGPVPRRTPLGLPRWRDVCGVSAYVFGGEQVALPWVGLLV
jgi:hypothetical protein